MRKEFDLFVYGTLRRGAGAADGPLAGCRHVASGTVRGTLFGVEERFPALVRGGSGVVRGEVWRCPVDRLPLLDRHEGVAEGLFRRVGVEVANHACWMYVAGPRLAPRLTPERRIASGDWLNEIGAKP